MEEETVVLKGRVEKTDIKYVWVSGGGCGACEDLDGEEFDSADDIPDRPHPNCQCYVDVIEVEGEDDEDGEGHDHGDSGSGDNDEPCDCPEQAEALFEELEEIIGDGESLADEIEAEVDDVEDMMSRAETMMSKMDEILEDLGEEYGQHKPDCENNIDTFYGGITAKKWELERLMRDILSILSPLGTLLQTVYIFVSNYIELLAAEQGDLDKYYHAKANCEASQLGILGSIVAEALSDLKEHYDQYTYVHTHKVSAEEALADSEADQVVNRIGRERGRNNPTCDCSVLIWDQRPENKR